MKSNQIWIISLFFTGNKYLMSYVLCRLPNKKDKRHFCTKRLRTLKSFQIFKTKIKKKTKTKQKQSPFQGLSNDTNSQADPIWPDVTFNQSSFLGQGRPTYGTEGIYVITTTLSAVVFCCTSAPPPANYQSLQSA